MKFYILDKSYEYKLCFFLYSSNNSEKISKTVKTFISNMCIVKFLIGVHEFDYFIYIFKFKYV